MNISAIVNSFKNLNRTNFEAFRQLVSITKGKPEISYLENARSCVQSMCNHYENLLATQDEEGERTSIYHPVSVSLDKIISGIRPMIEEAEMLFDTGYESSELFTARRDRIKAALETLSEEMLDPSTEYFKIGNCRTMHDYIRYLHQKGVEAFRQAISGYENSALKVARGRCLEYNVIDSNGIIQSEGEEFKDEDINAHEHHPLRQLIRYHTHMPQEFNFELFAIAKGNSLETTLKLGCHYAELACTIDPGRDDYSIRLKFIDTRTYDSSKQRTKYIRTCLENIGIEQTGENNIVECDQSFDDAATAFGKYGEVLRLLASTKDLDTNTSMKERWKLGVRGFMEGEKNIADYLERHKD